MYVDERAKSPTELLPLLAPVSASVVCPGRREIVIMIHPPRPRDFQSQSALHMLRPAAGNAKLLLHDRPTGDWRGPHLDCHAAMQAYSHAGCVGITLMRQSKAE